MMLTSSDSFVPPTACVAAGWIPSLLFELRRVNRDTLQTQYLCVPPILERLPVSAASVIICVPFLPTICFNSVDQSNV